MAKVKKYNQILDVHDSQVPTFLKDGFDQVELDESTSTYKVVKRATGGRAVSLAELNAEIEKSLKLEKENKRLKRTIELIDANFSVEQLKLELEKAGIEVVETDTKRTMIDKLAKAEG